MKKTDEPIIFGRDKLEVRVFPSIKDMGKAAADDVAHAIREVLSLKSEVNMVFAAAPSQEEFLRCLVADSSIDWSAVNAFHMDEYVGLGPDAVQRFGVFLRDRLFSAVPFKAVHYLDPSASDPDAECRRYSALLEEYPVDIVCLGIGENGHIAFNDPDVADFADPLMVKPVKLDSVCRMQQVNEKCFDTLDSVPETAVTLTVPALMKAERMFCVVPFRSKAPAVKNALYGPVSETCPASILRTKKGTVLYLDADSASMLDL